MYASVLPERDRNLSYFSLFPFLFSPFWIVMTTPSRASQLRTLLSERILGLDGGMGTMIQTYGLGEKDFRGERFARHSRDLKGNNDFLNLTRPDVIEAIHDAYFEAGADIAETNTFNSQSISQSDYGTAHLVTELNREAVRLARKAADAFTARTPAKPRFVCGVRGPTHSTASISPD